MARTKQTARKSSGGKAPKKQLAANSSGALKNYFTSQQKSGDNTKAVFINSENTFRDFSFPRTDESVDNDEFRPWLLWVAALDLKMVFTRSQICICVMTWHLVLMVLV